MTCSAVLMDTMSIQKYIFRSNRLRENLGASFLVKDIYHSHLEDCLKDVFPNISLNLTAWQESGKYQESLLDQQPVEVGYIGGGNALLLFADAEKARAFVKSWTTRLLVYTPGIVPAIAIMDDFDRDNFREAKKALFTKLGENKSFYIPATTLPRHGFTDECRSSGLSAEVWHSFDKENETERNAYFSAATKAKISASQNSRDEINAYLKRLQTESNSNITEEFCFTNNLELLGQEEDKDNDIAIVHIDGNGIGKKFQETKTLAEIRQLSSAVKIATENAFCELLDQIIKDFPKIEKEFKIQYQNSKKVLPLRPIIIGGDDITFVCPAKLGIYFARIFLEKFEAEDIRVGDEKIPHDACAGIVMVKTKYPFFRAYELAEELCANAKVYRRSPASSDGEGSFLDFHITFGGFTGSLSEIREKQYRVPQGDLLNRPYRFKSSGMKDFDTLVDNARKLCWKDPEKEETNFAHNKIKELRAVLSKGESAAVNFVKSVAARKAESFHSLAVESDFKRRLFSFPKDPEKSYTPYFDMIELAEYYPEYVLKKSREEEE